MNELDSVVCLLVLAVLVLLLAGWFAFTRVRNHRTADRVADGLTVPIPPVVTVPTDMTCVRTLTIGAVRATVGDALEPLGRGEHGAPRVKMNRILALSGGLIVSSRAEAKALAVAIDDLAKDMSE